MNKSQIWTLRYFRSHLLSSFPKLLSWSILIFTGMTNHGNHGILGFQILTPALFASFFRHTHGNSWKGWRGRFLHEFCAPWPIWNECYYKFEQFSDLCSMGLSQTWDVPKFMAIGHFMMKHWILGSRVAYFQRRFKSNLIHQNYPLVN